LTGTDVPLRQEQMMIHLFVFGVIAVSALVVA